MERLPDGRRFRARHPLRSRSGLIERRVYRHRFMMGSRMEIGQGTRWSGRNKFGLWVGVYVRAERSSMPPSRGSRETARMRRVEVAICARIANIIGIRNRPAIFT